MIGEHEYSYNPSMDDLAYAIEHFNDPEENQGITETIRYLRSRNEKIPQALLQTYAERRLRNVLPFGDFSYALSAVTDIIDVWREAGCAIDERAFLFLKKHADNLASILPTMEALRKHNIEVPLSLQEKENGILQAVKNYDLDFLNDWVNYTGLNLPTVARNLIKQADFCHALSQMRVEVSERADTFLERFGFTSDTFPWAKKL